MSEPYFAALDRAIRTVMARQFISRGRVVEGGRNRTWLNVPSVLGDFLAACSEQRSKRGGVPGSSRARFSRGGRAKPNLKMR